ncbi:hypothetical protein [Streptomyces achromogenes]|uniref:hypothetical protein n=1 Tax=Streptomyces achromogenes TaxID=67255 RepID=UPI003695A3F4
MTECSGKDPEKHFRVLHPWSFTPASPGGLETSMQRLRAALSKHGWKIVDYGPDTSKNRVEHFWSRGRQDLPGTGAS